MMWPDDYQPWFDLGAEIREAATRIVSTVQVRYSQLHGLNNPTIYAATLLFRTLHSYRATLSLARDGELVEASIIARSCVENVLWQRGLHQRGMDFVQDILGDGAKTEGALAKLILGMPDVVLDENMRKLAQEQAEAKIKTRIEVGKITSSYPAAKEYAVFRMLSNNYAHPSMRSLDCHVVRSPKTGVYELQMEPEAAPDRLLWTLFVASGAALTSVGLFLETFEAQDRDRFLDLGHGETLQLLTEKLHGLGRAAGLDGSDQEQPIAS